MSFTVQNLCDEALRLDHVLPPNASYQAGSGEYAICLNALNMLVDSFSVDGNTVYQISLDSIPLTGPASYQMGPNLTFSRPEKVRAGQVVSVAGPAMPAEIVSVENFTSIIDLAATGSFIEKVACDYGSPTATLYVWPAPASGTLKLWSIKPLAQFVQITDIVTFPPGYLELLKFNLAVAIVSEFPGAHLDQWVMEEAQSAKQRLAVLNAETIGMPQPPLPRMPMQKPLTETDIEQGKVAA